MKNYNKLWNNFYHSKIFWPLAALAAILLFNLVRTPSFFNIEVKDGHLFGSLIDILNRGTPLIILSLGMTIVIATENIDISIGSIVAIAGAVSATVISRNGPVTLAVILALLSGLAAGVWNGTLVGKIGVNPMVGTLILYTVGRGIAQLITKGQIITFNNPKFHFIGAGNLFIPFPIYIAVAVIIIITFIKKKTSLGLFIESVGTNDKSSKATGIKSENIIFLVYVICGIFASIAGIIICSNIKSADANNAGLWMELDAILATVIGGTSMSGGRFYLGGTVVGALFIQSLTTTIYTMGIKPEIVLLVKAIVVIVVCLIQSNEFRRMLTGKNSRKNKPEKKVVSA